MGSPPPVPKNIAAHGIAGARTRPLAHGNFQHARYNPHGSQWPPETQVEVVTPTWKDAAFIGRTWRETSFDMADDIEHWARRALSLHLPMDGTPPTVFFAGARIGSGPGVGPIPPLVHAVGPPSPPRQPGQDAQHHSQPVGRSWPCASRGGQPPRTAGQGAGGRTLYHALGWWVGLPAAAVRQALAATEAVWEEARPWATSEDRCTLRSQTLAVKKASSGSMSVGELGNSGPAWPSPPTTRPSPRCRRRRRCWRYR